MLRPCSVSRVERSLRLAAHRGGLLRLPSALLLGAAQAVPRDLMDGCTVDLCSDACPLPDPDRHHVDALLVPRAYVFTSASTGKCEHAFITIYDMELTSEILLFNMVSSVQYIHLPLLRYR
jgi:hypothetical protein